MARRKRRRIDATGRSQGAEQHYRIIYHFARHGAFRALSGPAVKVWIELRCRYNGANNGKLSLSLGEAADLLGMSKSTAKRAFAELVAGGFIRLRRQGEWYGRRASEWIVADVGYDGHPPTRDWENRWLLRECEKQNAVSRRNRGDASRAASVPGNGFACRVDTRRAEKHEPDGAA